MAEVNFRNRNTKRIDKYVQDTSYISLSGWMINHLKLKSHKLMIFGIIHSYTQGKIGYFYGSLTFLSKWCNCSKQTVINTLQDLVVEGLISKYGKDITGSDQIVYYVSNVNPDKLIKGEETADTYKSKKQVKKLDQYNNLTRPVKKFDKASQKFLPNNQCIENSINNNSYNNNKTTTVIEKQGNFVVEKTNKTSKGFNQDRIIQANAIQIARINEAERDTKTSKEVINYLTDSCNCFGIKQIEKINNLPDEDFQHLFSIAHSIVTTEGVSSFYNPKGYLSSQITKCIKAHA